MAKKSKYSWDEAILEVLTDEQKPIRYDDIANKIIEKGLRKEGEIGATPANTVNAILHGDKLKDKVTCVSRGVYILNSALAQNPSSIVGQTGVTGDEEENNEMDDALITAYGRFWDRTKFQNNDFTLYGRSVKTKNAPCVEFTQHPGIYLLHKGYQTVYVGQAKCLYKRLLDHTTDDKRNRWDNFSWFSIQPLDESGLETELKVKKLEGEALLDTLEALLIETLGPERNKKVGNEFEDKEFEQVTALEALKSKVCK